MASIPRLERHLVGLAADDERRAGLAQASRQLGKPAAAAVIVDQMERMLAGDDPSALSPERGERSG